MHHTQPNALSCHYSLELFKRHLNTEQQDTGTRLGTSKPADISFAKKVNYTELPNQIDRSPTERDSKDI